MDDNLTSYFMDQRQTLLADPLIRECLATFYSVRGLSVGTDEKVVLAYDLFIGEANMTLALIEGYYDTPTTLLEIGGGVGLVHGWLRYKGYNIVSIEPSLGGHNSFYNVGLRILELLGCPVDGWVSLRADEVGSLNRQFNLIFSNYVLEHISNLDASMRVLSRCLVDGGIMRHSCPNYYVPYEPHVSIPLVPCAPRLTALFPGSFKRTELWNGLSFVTSGMVRRLARRHELSCTLDSGVMYRIVQQLLRDQCFGDRHQLFRRIFSLMKSMGLLGLLKRIPASLTTPMYITLRKQCPAEDP